MWETGNNPLGIDLALWSHRHFLYFNTMDDLRSFPSGHFNIFAKKSFYFDGCGQGCNQLEDATTRPSSASQWCHFCNAGGDIVRDEPSTKTLRYAAFFCRASRKTSDPIRITGSIEKQCFEEAPRSKPDQTGSCVRVVQHRLSKWGHKRGCCVVQPWFVNAGPNYREGFHQQARHFRSFA